MEIRKDGDILEDAKLEHAIRNSDVHGNLMLEPQEEFTASQVKRLKNLYEEFFDDPGAANEAKTLAKDTINKLKEMTHELEKYLARSGEFPFLHLLQEPIQTLKDSLGKQYPWYVTEFVRQEDALLQMREDLLDPIRAFMDGAQKDIYKDARGYIKEQSANFAYIESDEVETLRAILDSPDCFRGNKMQQSKELLEKLRTKVDVQLKQEYEAAKEKGKDLHKLLAGMEEFGKLTSDLQLKLTESFDGFVKSQGAERLIPVIRESVRRFEEIEYPRIISQLYDWAQALVPPRSEPSCQPDASKPGSSFDNDATEPKTPPDPPKAQPPVEIISIRAAKVVFAKPLLTDEADVEIYLNSMREALLAELRNGKRIQV